MTLNESVYTVQPVLQPVVKCKHRVSQSNVRKLSIYTRSATIAEEPRDALRQLLYISRAKKMPREKVICLE